jgi:hypothetical protein
MAICRVFFQQACKNENFDLKFLWVVFESVLMAKKFQIGSLNLLQQYNRLENAQILVFLSDPDFDLA